MATPYYGWVLPTVGASADTWGTLLNDAFSDQDTQLASTPNTLKGNNTGATAASMNLTPAQVAAMLPNFIGDSGAGGFRGNVPAPATGDAAARKFLMASGSWVADEQKAWGNLTGAGALTAGRNMSVSRTGTGAYTVTFTTALASANFAVTTGYGGNYIGLIRVTDGTKTTGGFQFTVVTAAGSPIDVSEIYLSVLG